MVNDYFEPNGAPIKCTKCNSSNIREKILGVVDVYNGMGPMCEAEYFCECGECVGYWSYGSWDPAYKRDFENSLEEMGKI